MKLYEFDAVWSEETEDTDLIMVDIERIESFNKADEFKGDEVTNITMKSGSKFSLLVTYKEFKKLMINTEKELANKSI